MDEEKGRWGIWIDVEGFSNLWSAGDLALRGLGQLTSLIFEIGRKCYPRDGERLFAHQVGDGFYIASDFHEVSLDRCAALAIFLMRGMTEIGCVARASIAEGDLADYSGCRPREVQAEAHRNGDSDVVSLGDGLMTLQAIMGQGLINAVALDKLTNTKGAIVTIEAAKVGRLSSGFISRALEEAPAIMAIDWVHSTSPRIDEIAERTGLSSPSPETLARRLIDYVAQHSLQPKWSNPTFRYAGVGD
ncbi:hypothetical protein [Sphingomonas soli]|uniref:hypothetical protein n=1 Tax=Sphingomonas soli TaxID=266127 RepID=UPI0008341EF7|nr:hypothetical protein [Sphingomonas soli]